MSSITAFGPVRHLKAQPNQYILHFRHGKLVKEGPGLSYWYTNINAAVAELPTEDIVVTCLFTERSADMQDITVQVDITYRIADFKTCARRINFALSPRSGVWEEQPLKQLETIWFGVAQQPVRAYCASVSLEEALREGHKAILSSLADMLGDDHSIAARGLELVSVHIENIAPTSEVERALATPSREKIQQRADEAVFKRRALAVEKEREIKENEVSTEIRDRLAMDES